MLGTILTMLIIGVPKSILPRSSLEIFMLVYLVGIGMFLILVGDIPNGYTSDVVLNQ
jgi:hypothetical protein